MQNHTSSEIKRGNFDILVFEPFALLKVLDTMYKQID